MTVEELKKRKVQLNKDISKLVDDFIKETNVHVDEINLYRISTIGAKECRYSVTTRLYFK